MRNEMKIYEFEGEVRIKVKGTLESQKRSWVEEQVNACFWDIFEGGNLPETFDVTFVDTSELGVVL